MFLYIKTKSMQKSQSKDGEEYLGWFFVRTVQYQWSYAGLWVSLDGMRTDVIRNEPPTIFLRHCKSFLQQFQFDFYSDMLFHLVISTNEA